MHIGKGVAPGSVLAVGFLTYGGGCVFTIH
jgi:hypothetical protein